MKSENYFRKSFMLFNSLILYISHSLWWYFFFYQQAGGLIDDPLGTDNQIR